MYLGYKTSAHTLGILTPSLPGFEGFTMIWKNFREKKIHMR
jgi:hypothetical protein